MDKTKIVTVLYSNLHGTKFGGRASRGYHYLNSLKSILNITNADFVVYTSNEEYDFLNREFTAYKNITIKAYDLNNHFWKEIFDKYKNYEESKNSDRCIELQYSKLFWLKNEVEDGYEKIYWFDAGLSYTGLIPDKYMLCNGTYSSGGDYYNSKIFNNQLLNNLNKKTNQKLFLITKENQNNFWSLQPLLCFNNEYDQKWHVIGGIFGGESKLIPILFDKFNQLIDCTVQNYNKISWHEENLLTVIFYDNKELFTTEYFDVWWHENNCQSIIGELTINEFFTNKKSFYKILENLQ